MKNIYIILFLLSNIAYSQILILPLQGSGAQAKPNVYYKDVDNVFNKFVGTWKYEANGKIFIVVFQKKTMFHVSEHDNYIDSLVGEYKYSENGVELVNTLANLNIFHSNIFNYNIAGSIIINRDLEVFERGVELQFNDPDRTYLNASIVARYLNFEAPQEKIKIVFKGSLSILPDENSPLDLRVPEQEYILTKLH